MHTHMRFAVAVYGAVALILTTGAAAMDGEDEFGTSPAAAEYAKAEQAIKAKRWDEAVEWLRRALAKDDKNANVYNYLGYAERHRGNLEAAFEHYRRALALDPKHRGAHEYAGEAYLMVGNLAKAEEHLAALDKLCLLPCAEHRELKERIEAYKREPRR